MSLLKPPNNENLDNKVIRYDPKKFRGSKKIKHPVPKNRNLKLAVILIALSGFLLLIEMTELRSYIFSALNLEDYRSEIKNQSKVSASGEVVKKANDEAEAKLRPCTKLNEPKVSDEDIAFVRETLKNPKSVALRTDWMASRFDSRFLIVGTLVFTSLPRLSRPNRAATRPVLSRSGSRS